MSCRATNSVCATDARRVRLSLRLSVTLIAITCQLGVGLGSARSSDADSDPRARLCEYGITLALSGQPAAAESVFISLLSRAPHDPRALNNLGNLRLWRGDLDLALAFYIRAAETDSTDSGILLNEAVALTLLGDHETASSQAGEAVSRAGSPEEAARLLGLKYLGPEEDEDASERGADRVQLTREEVLRLLRAAAHAVPQDSTRIGDAGVKSARRTTPTPPWRSAGARASDEASGVAVYWKH